MSREFCYVGRHPVCHHMRAAVVDDGDRFTRQEVARFMKEGMVIERVTMAEVREHFAKDKCEICEPPKPKQGGLFAGEQG